MAQVSLTQHLSTILVAKWVADPPLATEDADSYYGDGRNYQWAA